MTPCPPTPAIPSHPGPRPPLMPLPHWLVFCGGEGAVCCSPGAPCFFCLRHSSPEFCPAPPTCPRHKLSLGSPSITCTHCHHRRIHFRGGRPGSIQLLGHKKGYAILSTRPDRPGRRPPPRGGSTRLAHSQAGHGEPPGGKPPPASGSGVITAPSSWGPVRHPASLGEMTNVRPCKAGMGRQRTKRA